MTRSFSWLGKCPSLMNGGLKLVLWCDAVMQKKILKEITNGKNKIKQRLYLKPLTSSEHLIAMPSISAVIIKR